MQQVRAPLIGRAAATDSNDSSYGSPGQAGAAGNAEPLVITSPVSGRVLRLF